jgi:hypothetical protein
VRPLDTRQSAFAPEHFLNPKGQQMNKQFSNPSSISEKSYRSNPPILPPEDLFSEFSPFNSQFDNEIETHITAQFNEAWEMYR